MLIVDLATTHGVADLASGLVVGKGYFISRQSLAKHSSTKRVNDAPTHMKGSMCFCISRKANASFELRA